MKSLLVVGALLTATLAHAMNNTKMVKVTLVNSSLSTIYYRYDKTPASYWYPLYIKKKKHAEIFSSNTIFFTRDGVDSTYNEHQFDRDVPCITIYITQNEIRVSYP